MDNIIYGGIQEHIKQFCSLKDERIVNHTASVSHINYQNTNLKKNYFKKNFSILGDIFSLNLIKFLFRNRNNFNVFNIHYPWPSLCFFMSLFIPSEKLMITYHSDITRNRILKKLIFYFIKRSFFKANLIAIQSKKYFKNSDIKNIKNNSIFFFRTGIKKKISKKKFNIKKTNLKLFDRFILFIGRERHYKGIEILKKLIMDNKNVNFVVISNSKELQKLKNENLIIYRSVNENIKHQIIKKCLFLILTSNNRAESYGLVLIEAQMNKKPAIVFKIGTGVNEIIKHKYNGYEIKNNNIEEFSKYTNFLYDKKT